MTKISRARRFGVIAAIVGASTLSGCVPHLPSHQTNLNSSTRSAASDFDLPWAGGRDLRDPDHLPQWGITLPGDPDWTLEQSHDEAVDQYRSKSTGCTVSFIESRADPDVLSLDDRRATMRMLERIMSATSHWSAAKVEAGATDYPFTLDRDGTVDGLRLRIADEGAVWGRVFTEADSALFIAARCDEPARVAEVLKTMERQTVVIL